MKSAVLNDVLLNDQQLRDCLLVASGFLAASDMPECSIAVLQAYEKLFGDLEIPSNTLAAAMIAKAKLDMQHNQEARREHGKGE